MKICTLGTTRIDFNIYQPYNPDNYDEIKLDKFDYKIGGSVYHASILLNLLGIDISYYTSTGNDRLSILSKSTLDEVGLNYITSSSPECRSSITFIHLDQQGEKKMFSYDGSSEHDNIIDILIVGKDNYDVFYTSCYEINQNNYLKISELIKDYAAKGKKTFIDLAPLAYKIPKHIWEVIIPGLKVILGTESEYKSLISILNIDNLETFIDRFNLERVYIKRGYKGCSVIENGKVEKYYDTQPVKSNNLTGCGDAFNTGIIYGEISNWNLDEITKIAMKLASNVAKFGFHPIKIIEE